MVVGHHHRFLSDVACLVQHSFHAKLGRKDRLGFLGGKVADKGGN